MLKSWEYIDPKLAHKLTQLTTQLNNLKQQRQHILHNKQLQHNMKTQLLNYNQQCIDNLHDLLKKENTKMVDYFDQQLNVVTKKDIGSVGSCNKELCTTKSTMERANKTKLDDTTAEEYHFEHNGRPSIKVEGFKLNPVSNPSRKSKASVMRPILRRVKRRYKKLRSELCLHQQAFQECHSLYLQQQHKNTQNQELIQLLKHKVQLLQHQNNDLLHSQANTNQQIHQLLTQQQQYEHLRIKNQELEAERRELMKFLGN